MLEPTDRRGAVPHGAGLPLVSVVISNYNYAAFVGQAIDSALTQTWPNVEVIVVDDGSTDESRTIIGRYGQRISALSQANRGHTGACNAGFARARGDFVVFLDADDVLAPSMLHEMVPLCSPGVSKVQCQMRIIDGRGVPTGATLPQYVVTPTSERIARWVNAACAYPTPPGSGNLYPRSTLAKLFPLDESERAGDSHCLAAAPYLGRIVALCKPLVSYRVHGANDGAMSTFEPSRFGRELARAQWRFRYATVIAGGQGITIPEDRFYRSLSVLAYRLASFKSAPERHPVADESLLRIVAQVFRAAFVPQGVSISGRMAFVGWAALVAVAPRRQAQALVLWRFSSGSRPAWLQRALGRLGVVGRHRPAPPISGSPPGRTLAGDDGASGEIG